MSAYQNHPHPWTDPALCPPSTDSVESASRGQNGENVLKINTIWILTDKNGKVLAKGCKRDIIKVASGRYVYEHIFDDCLYRTAELLGGAK